jgi:hemerythrin-like domain-containing protein
LTHEDMIRTMQGNMQQQPQIDVPVEKIDEFIKRCVDELHYNEHTLHQACVWKLHGQPEAPNYVVVSEAELQILPLVIRRLEGEGR